jgi:hypothetical protein
MTTNYQSKTTLSNMQPPTYEPYRSKKYKSANSRTYLMTKKQKVDNELRSVGVAWYGLLRPEAKFLWTVIHDDETIRAAMHGMYEDGTALLVATDKRVLFIDKKPFFVRSDELSYDFITGISYGKVGPISTITLHTRYENLKIRTFNFKSAKIFIEHIEERCLERESPLAGQDSW